MKFLATVLVALCAISANAWQIPSASPFGSVIAAKNNVCLRGTAGLRAAPGLGHRRATAVSLANIKADLDWYKCEKGEDIPGGAKYTFTVNVDEKISKGSFMVIMKEFKKTARFPGFRVGTIPPFMMIKVKQFVILDCLEKTLGEAVNDQNLELVSSDRKPTLDDAQVAQLTETFKEGKAFSYVISAELKSKPVEAPAA